MNIKNRINIDLKNIKKDCLLEEGKSAKFEKWFAKQSEKTDYWFKRNDFVEQTIDDFRELGPYPLSKILEAKLRDFKNHKSVSREEIYAHR